MVRFYWCLTSKHLTFQIPVSGSWYLSAIRRYAATHALGFLLKMWPFLKNKQQRQEQDNSASHFVKHRSSQTPHDCMGSGSLSLVSRCKLLGGSIECSDLIPVPGLFGRWSWWWWCSCSGQRSKRISFCCLLLQWYIWSILQNTTPCDSQRYCLVSMPWG